jgi:hypothetical protein
MKELLLLTLLVSCASKPNWREQHYQNANSGMQCIQLCSTHQYYEAEKRGCGCDAQKQPNLSSQSQSNGNTNTIYINAPQRHPANSDAAMRSANILNSWATSIKQEENQMRQQRNDYYNMQQMFRAFGR